MSLNKKLCTCSKISQEESSGPRIVARVPQVTIIFWIIKCLATALGETMADQMTSSLGDSRGKALAIFSCAMIAFLVVQFLIRRYLAPIYWTIIILVSITGTLVTDIMVDQANIKHYICTPVFFVLLCITFGLWYYFERDLSIHSIYTARREAFYWLVVLFTFALGTSVGDQLAEDAKLGYWKTLVIVVSIIIADFIILKILERVLKPLP